VLVNQILIDKHRELNVLEMLEQVAQRDFTSTKMVEIYTGILDITKISCVIVDL
jgi:hypothetical protein